jgi:hypothetical protein
MHIGIFLVKNQDVENYLQQYPTNAVTREQKNASKCKFQRNEFWRIKRAYI